VLVLQGLDQFPLLGLLIRKARRVFFPGFFCQDIPRYLARTRLDLRKASWIIWGGDLYGDAAARESDYVQLKKRVVQRLGSLLVVAPGDLEIARDFYGFDGPGYYGLYLAPVNRELLDQFPPARGGGREVVVQINNSSDESILEVIEQLKAFRDRPLRLRVILSYGNQACKQAILNAGSAAFGERFTAVTDYLPPDQYAKLISETDLLVMNQPRQQGLGNIYAFLYQGAKVYIRSDVTTWSFLRQRGFALSDTLNLSNESFESLVQFDPVAGQGNRRLAASFLDERSAANLWREIFDGRAPELTLNS
jgi:hypothetical protein